MSAAVTRRAPAAPRRTAAPRARAAAPATRTAPGRRTAGAPARRRPAAGPRRIPSLRAARAAAAPGAILDRLLGGQMWIGLIGALLAGIVFLNVTLLEQGEEIAGMAERAAAMKRDNAILRDKLAKRGSTERIQELARARGFVLPTAGEVGYVKARPADDAVRAARLLDGGGEAVASAPPAGEPDPVAAAPVEGQQAPLAPPAAAAAPGAEGR